MARNIYDLFNERKYGVDYLVEGYDVETEDVEAYESLEEATEALERITQESTNEAIELQAAWYLEDLVIESMMFDDFDEAKIAGVMEGSMKGKVKAAKDKIMAMWKRMKEWFIGTAKAIANHFRNGEQLVSKYGGEIDSAMKNCKIKVKMNNYKDFSAAANAVTSLIDDLKGEQGDKDAVLKKIGAEDRKDVANVVKKLYIEKEGEEQLVSSISPQKAKYWAGNKKIILDNLKKIQKNVDDDFKAILKEMKENESKAEGAVQEALSKAISNFHFVMGVKNTILNTQIAVVRKACTDYAMIIRKALNTPANAKANKKAEKQEKLGDAAAVEGFLPQLDEVEFLENDDDFNW